MFGHSPFTDKKRELKKKLEQERESVNSNQLDQKAKTSKIINPNLNSKSRNMYSPLASPRMIKKQFHST